MILINYIVAFFLLVLGMYCIVTKYDLVKTVIGLLDSLLDGADFLTFIGYFIPQ